MLQLTANVAFGVALQQVFKDESLAVTESSDDFPGGDPDDCMAVYVSLGGSTMWRSLILLWEIVLGGDLHLGCLRESVHSYVATALMYASSGSSLTRRVLPRGPRAHTPHASRCSSTGMPI
mgnify:FL=1